MKQRFWTNGFYAIGATIGVTLLVTGPAAHADDDEDSESGDSRIEQGFRLAPVPLNLQGRNRALVGLGSYFVNSIGGCNNCHNPGPGENRWLPGGNPYFGQPERNNPATYLGGGRDFGPLVPGSAHIISRWIWITSIPTVQLVPSTQAAFRFRSTVVFSRSCRGQLTKT